MFLKHISKKDRNFRLLPHIFRSFLHNGHEEAFTNHLGSSDPSSFQTELEPITEKNVYPSPSISHYSHEGPMDI